MKPNEEKLTAERIRALLDYNPETGEFRWRSYRNGNAMAGSVAGSPHREGYISIRIDASPYLAHRLAWVHTHGEWPANQIDHINGVRHDNRIVNLREAGNCENQQNLRKSHRDNKTGLLGAYWHKEAQKFSAQISVNGNLKYLGLFNTAEEAHQAYLKAKRELHSHCTL